MFSACATLFAKWLHTTDVGCTMWCKREILALTISQKIRPSRPSSFLPLLIAGSLSFEFTKRKTNTQKTKMKHKAGV